MTMEYTRGAGGLLAKAASLFAKEPPTPTPTPPGLVSRERAVRLRDAAAMKVGSIREMQAKFAKSLATAEADLCNAQMHLDRLDEHEAAARVTARAVVPAP
ncbi:hypothetical protein [Roseomonas sp. CECT 9278]|uniref:hypothetical protein n=1 Tax=Roseomonas sp. CECT 9278 TaxID=2845823 RepID=UPI001E43A775|nr:hypothetical protein [Roseomonas sp. CECT 9278]CAH0169759.1 hypothetical protein ROS9278_01166 [Roseomonas sp. CECT 9278]